jgi:hypothetical protein
MQAANKAQRIYCQVKENHITARHRQWLQKTVENEVQKMVKLSTKFLLV